MKRVLLKIIRGIFGTDKIINKIDRLGADSLFYFYEHNRSKLIDHIVNDKTSGVSYEHYCKHDIIVSLTTYGKRIYDVAFTIESIMQQSLKPNKIILWLDYSFKEKRLPQYLLWQMKRGLEIEFCKDIRSYTKLVPALCKYPNDAIITIDDDAIYEPDFLERLILPYLEDPSYIYCHRFHKIKFDNLGVILPYMQWEWRSKDESPSHLNFATGVGGVLYPPHSLDEEVKNESVFLDICKYADDVWFYAMALKKGTMVKRVYSRNKYGEEYLINEGVQDTGLARINNDGDFLNDKQIWAVFEKYNLFEKLKETE